MRFDAFVDSGASYSIFKTEIGKDTEDIVYLIDFSLESKVASAFYTMTYKR